MRVLYFNCVKGILEARSARLVLVQHLSTVVFDLLVLGHYRQALSKKGTRIN